MMSRLENDAQSGNTARMSDKLDWYVYYRVRTEHAALLQARVTTMQIRLQTEFGIAGALKRRPLAQEGRHTWMEIYLAAGPDFDAILGAAVSAANLPELIDGERHTEHFLDVTSCA